jgi:hypothetical protein
MLRTDDRLKLSAANRKRINFWAAPGFYRAGFGSRVAILGAIPEAFLGAIPAKTE